MNDEGGRVSLTYESSMAGRISTIRRTAWISLLVLGILTDLLGVCLGGMAVAIVSASGAAAPGIPGHTPILLWMMAAAFLLVPMSVGAVEIVCSWKIRSGSRRMAIVAAVIVGLKLLAIAGMIAFSVVGQVMNGMAPGDLKNMVVGNLFPVAIGLMLGVLEWLLIRVMRE